MISDLATAYAIHASLEILGMALGVRHYFSLRQRAGAGSPLIGSNYAVLAGCLFVAGLGNKAVFWIEMPHLWAEHGGFAGFFLGGQSMIGGLPALIFFTTPPPRFVQAACNGWRQKS